MARPLIRITPRRTRTATTITAVQTFSGVIKGGGSGVSRGQEPRRYLPPISYTIDPNSPMALHPDEYGVRVLFRNLGDYARAARGTKTVDFIGHETRELRRGKIAKLIDRIKAELAPLQRGEALELKVEFEEKP